MLMVIVALAVATVPNSAGAVDLNENKIYISAISLQDGDEFVMLQNRGADIDVTTLTLEFYNSSNNLSEKVTLSDGTFLSDSSILISNNAARLPDSGFAKNLLPQSGRVKILLDDEIIAENCWGNVACQNQTTGVKTGEYLVNECNLTEDTPSGCGSLVRTSVLPTIAPGGWKADPVNIDPGTDPVDPVGPINPDNPPGPGLNLDCELLTISEIGANVSDQFIEISNLTDDSLNVKGCLLATNRNAKQFAMPDLNLKSQTTYLVKISETGLTLSKTTAGQVFLLSSDGLNEIQSVSYPAMKSGNSWAFIAETWKNLSKPSPGAINIVEPINLCVGLRLSEIGANLDQQFIELFNDSAEAINIKGCQIMTNRSSVKAFSLPDETINTGSYRVINIAGTELTLTKTTEGEVYLLSSDGELEIDRINYGNLAKGTSFSLLNDQWLQTYSVTPGSTNIYQEYPDCESGYYRNLETGRCNKIIAPTVLSACQDGYYRNLETNRCRKIAESTATLTACKAGYVRNSETNRCRKITTESDGLKACAEGYERNPETNRCRKIISSTEGTFPVNPDAGTGGNLAWTVGATLLVAMTGSVIAYQYRMEIGRTFRRLLPSGSSA